MPTPNPRPVTVDARGQLYETTGEPIVVPGLEPETVLQGLADLREGRVRPLQEILPDPRRKDE